LAIKPVLIAKQWYWMPPRRSRVDAQELTAFDKTLASKLKLVALESSSLFIKQDSRISSNTLKSPLSEFGDMKSLLKRCSLVLFECVCKKSWMTRRWFWPFVGAVVLGIIMSRILSALSKRLVWVVRLNLWEEKGLCCDRVRKSCVA